jgi:hypothetical protein
MKITILSINHGEQNVVLKDEVAIPEIRKTKENIAALIRKTVAEKNVDLICEESDPCHLSIAQNIAFEHNPRIPWLNISMTSQERLEAGIWEALLYRPCDFDPKTGIGIDIRVPEDEIREEFFKAEILGMAKGTGATSVLVLCGDMHTEALRLELEEAGHEVKTDHSLTPAKRWK